tara:strand:+ start:3462 stop:3764 length:303 start_codon:yes stop_codon:yes gene_type:complete
MTLKHLIPCAALVAAFFWTPVGATEQVSCPPRGMLVQSLKDNGMLPAWRGWSDRGHITEIWMSKDEETKWMAVVHLVSGYSCVMDEGIKPKLMGQSKVGV